MNIFMNTGGRVVESAFGLTRVIGLVSCVLVSAALLISAPVNAWTIDFEDSFLDLPNPVVSGQIQGRIIDDEFSTPGLIDTGAADHDPTLTASFSGFKLNGSENPVVMFDSNNPTGGDYDLAAPFYHYGNDANHTNGEILNPGHILILHEQRAYCRNASGGQVHGNNSSAVSCDDPDDRIGGKFVIEFNKEITLESIDFFDIEYAEGHPDGPANEVLLFDINGDQILTAGPFYTPSTGGDNKWRDQIFGVAGVAKIKINCEGSCAIDNIEGTQPGDPPVNTVSEPSALLVFGLGIFGAVVLRRRRRIARVCINSEA
jgi:hypothetical protein